MKTYFFVKYAVLGKGIVTAWFDNKEDADDFYNNTIFSDKPKEKTSDNKEYGKRVARTQFVLKNEKLPYRLYGENRGYYE